MKNLLPRNEKFLCIIVICRMNCIEHLLVHIHLKKGMNVFWIESIRKEEITFLLILFFFYSLTFKMNFSHIELLSGVVWWSFALTICWLNKIVFDKTDNNFRQQYSITCTKISINFAKLKAKITKKKDPDVNNKMNMIVINDSNRLNRHFTYFWFNQMNT